MLYTIAIILTAMPGAMSIVITKIKIHLVTNPISMKRQFLHVLLMLFPSVPFAQSLPNNDNATYKDIVYTDEINGMKVMASDTLYSMIESNMEAFKSLIDDSERYPRLYVTNKNSTEFLEIWGAPDLGFRQFYTIGYTQKHACSYCGTHIGKMPFEQFYINAGIKLGDDVKIVWEKAHLNYFRSFTFNGVVYFYFEKGMKLEVPFTPGQIFYYKFKDDKLIEVGFGNGFTGVNPMLQDMPAQQ